MHQRAGVFVSPGSPRTGASSAPVHHHESAAYRSPPGSAVRPLSYRGSLLAGQLAAPSSPGVASLPLPLGSSSASPTSSPAIFRRRRAQSLGSPQGLSIPMSPRAASGRKIFNDTSTKARARDAQRLNDSMVYLDGAQVYSCAQCRTHLTSHDDIISKSFHGRHGRAYLFDQCVNVTIGAAEDRLLITGLHSVCDIFCKRCKNLVGWTYQKAYENSQKYKEGKYIIEKINLHLEESGCYDVAPPAGEKVDRWRKRSMSWGSESSASIIYEYRLGPSTSSSSSSIGGCK